MSRAPHSSLLARSPVLSDLDAKIRKAKSLFASTGSNLLQQCCTRDTLRESLKRRRPHWCESEAVWQDYQAAIRERLQEVVLLCESLSASMTSQAEKLDALELREREALKGAGLI